jgi:hypothetical protein
MMSLGKTEAEEGERAGEGESKPESHMGFSLVPTLGCEKQVTFGQGLLGTGGCDKGQGGSVKTRLAGFSSSSSRF